MINWRSEQLSTDVPAIPRLADVSPTYLQLVEKEQALKDRQKKLNHELRDFQHIQKDSQRDRVAALLESDEKPASTPTRRIEDISQDIYDVQDALDIIAHDISRERMKASNEICAQVAPEYRQHVREIFSALIALNAACRKYEQFTAMLNAENIAWSQMRPMRPNFLGEPYDKYSSVALWMREAAEYSFITKAEIPEHLR